MRITTVGNGREQARTGESRPGRTEVADPYGADLASYRATFSELQELIGNVVSRVAGTVR